MATNSLTFFHNQEKKPVVCMYGHYDGYMSGHGLDLAKFITSKTLVNGLGLDSNEGVANGMECLAAQAVAHFKKEPGDYYLYPYDTTNDWNSFEYHVYADKVVVKTDHVMFAGTWQEFLEECKNED